MSVQDVILLPPLATKDSDRPVMALWRGTDAAYYAA